MSAIRDQLQGQALETFDFALQASASRRSGDRRSTAGKTIPKLYPRPLLTLSNLPNPIKLRGFAMPGGPGCPHRRPLRRLGAAFAI